MSFPSSKEMNSTDQYWMRQALALADQGASQGEVPVGAILVRDGQCLGQGYNQPISSHDPTAHAEIIALREAARGRRNYRLPGTTLYVTLEPCTMCVGALIHARIEHLAFAAPEPKAGAVISRQRLLDQPLFNWRITWRQGPLTELASEQLRSFFRQRRNPSSGQQR